MSRGQKSKNIVLISPAAINWVLLLLAVQIILDGWYDLFWLQIADMFDVFGRFFKIKWVVKTVVCDKWRDSVAGVAVRS